MRISIYARVSTEKQERQETIKSQLEALRDYAKHNNFALIEEYIDDGFSGELLDRPALDKLRDDAKKKLFDAVLIHSQDRLSRKFLYAGLVQEELKKVGVNIIFLNRPDSKDTPEDNLLNGVQSLIAEYEKAKIIERTRRGRIHKAKQNILVGTQAPYGYQYFKGDPMTGTLNRYIIKDAEAETVKLIFALFVEQGLSIRAVARELTKRGIPPQRGIHWRSSSLHRILRNETYAGITYYRKYIATEPEKPRDTGKPRRAVKTSLRLRPRTDWMPIALPDNAKVISRETFEAAQLRLKKNSKMSPRNVKHQYLLRGLTKCGKCGAPLYGENCKGTLYYRCGDRARTFPLPRICKAYTVRRDILEQIVWDKFCEAVSNPKLIMEQVEKHREKISKVNLTKDIENLDKNIEKLSLEEGRLLDAYRANAISLDQLKEQMGKVNVRREQLSVDRKTLLQKQAEMISASAVQRSIKHYCEVVTKNLERYQNDFEAKRWLMTEAITKVSVADKNIKVRGIIPAYVPESPLEQECIAFTNSGSCGLRRPQFPEPA